MTRNAKGRKANLPNGSRSVAVPSGAIRIVFDKPQKGLLCFAAMCEEKPIDILRGRRVGLVLSAGFFGFFHHAGVVSALEEAGVTACRITGNSAGALIGGMLASGMSPAEIQRALFSLKRRDFWDLHVPVGPGGLSLLAGHRLQALLGRTLCVHSFEACPVPLTVGVYHIDTGRMAYIDQGSLIKGVYASLAIPYLFPPEVIDGQRYWDGGFAEKTPLVPYLDHDDVDIILVSYLPQRRKRTNRDGILGFLPPLSALFADVPYEERTARDRASLEALEKAGKQVYFLAPTHLPLGPFSMEKGRQAFEQGYTGTQALLNKPQSAWQAPWAESTKERP